MPTLAFARDAYVVSPITNTLSQIDLDTNTALPPNAVGDSPQYLAITPDGEKLYITSSGDNTVKVVDRDTQTVTATIPVGNFPYFVAIAPDGERAYVSNINSNDLSVIDTATDTVINTIPTAPGPAGVAVHPDGSKYYVVSVSTNTVSVYDTQTDLLIGAPIILPGSVAFAIAITPDGETIYVTSTNSDELFAIDADTQVVDTPIPIGLKPFGVDILPDSSEAYVANSQSDTLAVLETATNTFTSTPVGNFPIGVAVHPDGKTVYTTNLNSATVSVMDASNHNVFATIATTGGGSGIAITPNQGPTAGFNGDVISGEYKVSFDAGSSTDSDGTILRYDWDFGDGQVANDGGKTITHTYSTEGDYQVKLTVTDNEECSKRVITTGQTATCNGSDKATAQKVFNLPFVPVPPEPDPDPGAPQTTITQWATFQKEEKSIFRFKSSQKGSRFRCRIDDKKYTKCESPVNYMHLRRGYHTFRVRAINQFGTKDPTPAKRRFFVK